MLVKPIYFFYRIVHKAILLTSSPSHFPTFIWTSLLKAEIACQLWFLSSVWAMRDH